MVKWTGREDAKLEEAVGVHGRQWDPVAAAVGRSAAACEHRWRSDALEPARQRVERAQPCERVGAAHGARYAAARSRRSVPWHAAQRVPME